MLLEIRVQKFAIIDELHLSFKRGLNILSGETGSGKSVLLKSLGLLMGDKAQADTVRSGHTQALVEGSFDLSHRKDILTRLESMGVSAEDEVLVVRRLISQGDKSKVYLNGQLSTLQSLREIVAPMIEVTGQGAPLIEMTGQHENRHLLSKLYHLELLDQHSNTLELRSKYEEEYSKLKTLQSELQGLTDQAQGSSQRLDFLIYQSEEINLCKLTEGDEERLESEVKRLKGSGKLIQYVEIAEAALSEDEDSALIRLKNILKKFYEISSLDPELAAKASKLTQAQSLIEEVLYQMRHHVQVLDSEPELLEKFESELSQLRKLQKKYGPKIQDILEFRDRITAEINLLQNSEARAESLKKEILKKEMILKKWATELHQLRVQGAKKLAKRVNEELEDLNMKGVTFHIQVESSSQLLSSGSSEVEFMSQTSAKDAPKALAKFASGGELSRILLSLKRVAGESRYPRTYLFDEVDSGVSGPTAEKVGKKLSSISQGQQVICVTHLPQVAAFGDAHFLIHKNVEKTSVKTEVIEVSGQARVEEIARLISGEKLTKTSLAHAKELIQGARTR